MQVRSQDDLRIPPPISKRSPSSIARAMDGRKRGPHRRDKRKIEINIGLCLNRKRMVFSLSLDM